MCNNSKHRIKAEVRLLENNTFWNVLYVFPWNLKPCITFYMYILFCIFITCAYVVHICNYLFCWYKHLIYLNRHTQTQMYLNLVFYALLWVFNICIVVIIPYQPVILCKLCVVFYCITLLLFMQLSSCVAFSLCPIWSISVAWTYIHIYILLLLYFI